MMKKTGIATALVLVGVMAWSSAFAGSDAGVANDTGVIAKVAQRVKPVKAAPSSKKKFRYLDMVEIKPSPSIRNAVIVYGHALMKKHVCSSIDASVGSGGATDVSECLRRPTT